jgi:hypothetical protein
VQVQTARPPNYPATCTNAIHCIAERWIQVEIFFSIVQRKVLIPNDFVDLVEVEHRLLGFQRRYEQIVPPFDWRYTRSDLDRLCGS